MYLTAFSKSVLLFFGCWYESPLATKNVKWAHSKYTFFLGVHSDKWISAEKRHFLLGQKKKWNRYPCWHFG